MREVDLGRVEAADVLDGPEEACLGLEGDGLGVGGVIVEAQAHRDVGRGEGLAHAIGEAEEEAVGPGCQLRRGQHREDGRPIRGSRLILSGGRPRHHQEHGQGQHHGCLQGGAGGAARRARHGRKGIA